MSKMPLVSIVMPIYNGSNYMREAINSALAQTYENIEILIVNDGSTDNTEEIALEYVQKYGDKFRYFAKENGGVVSALNFGIDNMKGEYFSWLSHDDLYLPGKIEKQVTALLENNSKEKPVFCVCNCTFIDEKGNEKFKSGKLDGNSFSVAKCDLLIGKSAINGLMVLIPKKLFDLVGKFEPSLAVHEYDMWLRLMDVADIVVVEEYLVEYRLHEKQIWHIKRKEADIETDEFLAYHILEIPPPVFAIYWQKQGAEWIFQLILGWNGVFNNACLALLQKLTPEMHLELLKSPLLSVGKLNLAIKKIENAYKNSFCWKITKPIRVISSFFKTRR